MSANSQQPWPGALPPIATPTHQGLMPKFVAPLTSSGGANPTLSVAAATTGAAGSLSAADKTKLDSMERPLLLLNYIAAADLAVALALAAGTWKSIGPNNAFALTSATAIALLFVRGNIICPNAGSAMIGSSVLIDGGIRVMLGGGYSAGATTNMYTNALAGSNAIPLVLAGGPHTVQVQIISNIAGLAFCRPQTQPDYESLAVSVLEIAP